MADWYGSARSNYFKVKDVQKFTELCKLWSVEMISDKKKVIINKCETCLGGKPNKECKNYVTMVVGECVGNERKQMLYGFLGNEDNGGLPNYRCDEETGKEYDQDDFFKELAPLIKDNWIAIMMECGAEKLRYVTGYAVAVNSKGKTEWINLNDIYGKTEPLGKFQTMVEY